MDFENEHDSDAEHSMDFCIADTQFEGKHSSSAGHIKGWFPYEHIEI